jgi:hypothetical protein
MFAIQSNRNARPVKAIFSRLKSASEQFSKTRPAVIWGHFLGLDEDDFKDLLERPNWDIEPSMSLATIYLRIRDAIIFAG